jgi:hypothetical protein
VRSRSGNPRALTDAANWSDDDSEREERDTLGEAEREAGEQAQRAREAAKRMGIDADSEPDDD